MGLFKSLRKRKSEDESVEDKSQPTASDPSIPEGVTGEVKTFRLPADESEQEDQSSGTEGSEPQGISKDDTTGLDEETDESSDGDLADLESKDEDDSILDIFEEETSYSDPVVQDLLGEVDEVSGAEIMETIASLTEEIEIRQPGAVK